MDFRLSESLQPCSLEESLLVEAARLEAEGQTDAWAGAGSSFDGLDWPIPAASGGFAPNSYPPRAPAPVPAAPRAPAAVPAVLPDFPGACVAEWFAVFRHLMTRTDRTDTPLHFDVECFELRVASMQGGLAGARHWGFRAVVLGCRRIREAIVSSWDVAVRQTQQFQGRPLCKLLVCLYYTKAMQITSMAIMHVVDAMQTMAELDGATYCQLVAHIDYLERTHQILLHNTVALRAQMAACEQEAGCTIDVATLAPQHWHLKNDVYSTGCLRILDAVGGRGDPKTSDEVHHEYLSGLFRQLRQRLGVRGLPGPLPVPAVKTLAEVKSFQGEYPSLRLHYTMAPASPSFQSLATGDDLSPTPAAGNGFGCSCRLLLHTPEVGRVLTVDEANAMLRDAVGRELVPETLAAEFGPVVSVEAFILALRAKQTKFPPMPPTWIHHGLMQDQNAAALFESTGRLAQNRTPGSTFAAALLMADPQEAKEAQDACVTLTNGIRARFFGLAAQQCDPSAEGAPSRVAAQFHVFEGILCASWYGLKPFEVVDYVRYERFFTGTPGQSPPLKWALVHLCPGGANVRPWVLWSIKNVYRGIVGPEFTMTDNTRLPFAVQATVVEFQGLVARGCGCIDKAWLKTFLGEDSLIDIEQLDPVTALNNAREQGRAGAIPVPRKVPFDPSRPRPVVSRPPKVAGPRGVGAPRQGVMRSVGFGARVRLCVQLVRTDEQVDGPHAETVLAKQGMKGRGLVRLVRGASPCGPSRETRLRRRVQRTTSPGRSSLRTGSPGGDSEADADSEGVAACGKLRDPTFVCYERPSTGRQPSTRKHLSREVGDLLKDAHTVQQPEGVRRKRYLADWKAAMSKDLWQAVTMRRQVPGLPSAWSDRLALATLKLVRRSLPDRNEALVRAHEKGLLSDHEKGVVVLRWLVRMYTHIVDGGNSPGECPALPSFVTTAWTPSLHGRYVDRARKLVGALWKSSGPPFILPRGVDEGFLRAEADRLADECAFKLKYFMGIDETTVRGDGSPEELARLDRIQGMTMTPSDVLWLREHANRDARPCVRNETTVVVHGGTVTVRAGQRFPFMCFYPMFVCDPAMFTDKKDKEDCKRINKLLSDQSSLFCKFITTLLRVQTHLAPFPLSHKSHCHAPPAAVTEFAPDVYQRPCAGKNIGQDLTVADSAAGFTLMDMLKEYHLVERLFTLNVRDRGDGLGYRLYLVFDERSLREIGERVAAPKGMMVTDLASTPGKLPVPDNDAYALVLKSARDDASECYTTPCGMEGVLGIGNLGMCSNCCCDPRKCMLTSTSDGFLKFSMEGPTSGPHDLRAFRILCGGYPVLGLVFNADYTGNQILRIAATQPDAFIEKGEVFVIAEWCYSEGHAKSAEACRADPGMFRRLAGSRDNAKDEKGNVEKNTRWIPCLCGSVCNTPGLPPSYKKHEENADGTFEVDILDKGRLCGLVLDQIERVFNMNAAGPQGQTFDDELEKRLTKHALVGDHNPSHGDAGIPPDAGPPPSDGSVSEIESRYALSTDDEATGYNPGARPPARRQAAPGVLSEEAAPGALSEEAGLDEEEDSEPEYHSRAAASHPRRADVTRKTRGGAEATRTTRMPTRNSRPVRGPHSVKRFHP